MVTARDALRDSLTGLQDRDAFITRLQAVIDSHPLPGLSVVYLRMINMGAYILRKGVGAGDQVLKDVSKRLSTFVPTRQLGRYASGSFMALMPTDKVESILEAINRDLSSAGEVEGLVFKAGYCELRLGLTAPQALDRARYAFEDVQFSSSVYTRLFDRGLENAYNRRAYVVEHLDDAIARGEIRAYCQPIVRVLTRQICEVEVLSRWESEEHGFLRPDEFIPELERHQLIHRLDAEVVRLACKQWKDAAEQGVCVPFGINLSRLDFELCDIYSVVTELIERYGVPVDQVHIEVTESALSHSNEMLIAGIQRFREAGFKLYLDDFGSGYSSLSVLEGTLFDVVKLDMSLLQEVETNERARVIVADAVSMVKRLALQTLCEGVETEDQFLFLNTVGCEKAQGYYFSKPLPHEEIMEHLHETIELHEQPEDVRYYDSVGRVNLMDGTRSSVQGVEAAHFFATQPFAIMEVRDDQRISFLSANTAFIRFVQKSQAMNIAEFVDRLSADLAPIRTRMLYASSKAHSTGQAQRLDFIMDGSFCTVGISFLDGSEGREAFLLEIVSVTKYSQYNDFRLLEQSLGFLYTIFKRIDLLDVTDNTWHNIYLNVPRYSAIAIGATPNDEINAFCQTFIHPDDRARFYEFYDLSTIDQRLREAPTNHVASTFFALSDNDRYEDHIFMLIPISLDGHKQYLSCMRDIDLDGVDRNQLSGGGSVSDEVLLTGILDVADRFIFWKDNKRRFLGANQRFLDYYGFVGAEDIMGKTDEDLGWGKRNEFFRDDELRVLAGDRVCGVRGYTRNVKGELRDIEISKMPLTRDGRIVGMVGFFRDLGPHGPEL